MRLLFVVTHPMTARILLRGQLGFLRDAGFEVGVAAGPGLELAAVAAAEGVRVFPVAGLRREIAPLGDLVALARLVVVMRRFRPSIVNAGTPKAGLLGMLAARMARVPIRIYTLRGLRLETARGAAGRILAGAERMAMASAHRVVCVSESLRQRCRELGLSSPDKMAVLGPGSSNGVDIARFDPGRRVSPEVDLLRRALRIPIDVPVVGFLGRLTGDKGIDQLADAFCGTVAERFATAHLLLVGEYEEGDPVAGDVVDRLEAHPRVVRAGFLEDTSACYGLMSVLVLPSRREGFPNAPLEAAASGVPVVGYRVTGTVDAVEDGVTGTLVAPGDVAGLARAIASYLADPGLARRHGEAGRQRVERVFRREDVWRRWLDEYRRLASEPSSRTTESRKAAAR